LVSYGNRYNTCNIEETYQYQLSDGNVINLGEWLAIQRALNKTSQLPTDRQTKMQDLVDKNVLTWDNSQTLDDYWNLVFEVLLCFLEKYSGCCNIPYYGYATLADNTKIYLGKWVSFQWQQYFEKILPHDRLILFQELIDQDKLIWTMPQIIRLKKVRDEKWKVYYEHLLQYGKEHNGYVNAPDNTVLTLPDKTEVKLGEWLVCLRKLHGRGELSSFWEEKFQKFVDARKFSWKQGFP